MWVHSTEENEDAGLANFDNMSGILGNKYKEQDIASTAETIRIKPSRSLLFEHPQLRDFLVGEQ